MEPNDIISNELIEKIYANADFGERLNNNKREVVDNALLKFACGYSNGHTAQCIIEELGLVNNGKLTKTGRMYLWDSFCLNGGI